MGQVRVLQQTMSPAGETGSVAYRHQKTGLPVDDQISVSRDVSRDDRDAGRHRFQHGVRLAFVLAAEPQAIKMRHQPGHIAAFAQEMHPVGDLDLVAVTLQPPALRAVADDQQMRIVAGHF